MTQKSIYETNRLTDIEQTCVCRGGGVMGKERIESLGLVDASGMYRGQTAKSSCIALGAIFNILS